MTRIVLALVVAAIAVYVIMRIAQGQSPSVAKSSLPALDPADIQEAAAIARVGASVALTGRCVGAY